MPCVSVFVLNREDDLIMCTGHNVDTHKVGIAFVLFFAVLLLYSIGIWVKTPLSLGPSRRCLLGHRLAIGRVPIVTLDATFQEWTFGSKNEQEPSRRARRPTTCRRRQGRESLETCPFFELTELNTDNTRSVRTA